MSKPLVAVVGRPNVGKSTFFNKVSGQRISIVEDTPGVTRDRIYTDVEWQGRHFTLIDTGGIDVRSEDVFLAQMRRQAQIAIDTADVILFFTDGRVGLTDDDQEVADLLRKSGKPVLLVVNKIDHISQADAIYEFYALGIGDPIAISSANMMNFGDLLDEICALLPEPSPQEAEEDHILQLAVVGRPNVGKSSLVNRLLGQERTMVSNIAGTTRDAIDTAFTAPNGTTYNLIDTAGIRKKSAVPDESIEKYAVLRAIAAIERCDVALLLLDARDGVTEQDTKIAGMIHDAGKAVVIVVNKWDLIEKDTNTMERMRKEILDGLKFMDWAPVLFLSALTGSRTQKVLEQVDEVWAQATKRISTGLLNDVITDATADVQPPSDNGHRLKIYYATQQGVCPPTFIFFVNREELMHFSYLRYLENYLRKTFDFTGAPLRMIVRERQKKE